MTTPLIMTLAHGGLATFGPMASTAVLGQADSQGNSVATWLGVLGQWVGAIATVWVALWLARGERRRSEAERRDREAEQARLITIEVDYSDYKNPPPYKYGYAMAWVVITNNGEQRVLRSEIDQVRDVLPKVRWGREVSAEGGEPFYSPPEVLMPLAREIVPFEHVDDDGLIVTPAEAVDGHTVPQADFDSGNIPNIIPKITTPGKVKKWVDIDNVTITFTDMSSQRWQRTGNREPLRVPAQAD